MTLAPPIQPRPPDPPEGPEVESLVPLKQQPPEEELLQAYLDEMRDAAGRQCSVPELVRLLPKAVRVTREFNHLSRPSHMLAWKLIALLRQLASGGDSREAADVLLGLLEGGHLEGLSAFQGPTCRSVAVETLLRMGFPYALEIRPEDLKYLRRQRLWRKLWRHVFRPLAAVVLGLGLVGQWLTFSPESITGSAGQEAVTIMVVQLLGLMAGILGAEHSPSRVLGLVVLAVSSLLPLWMSPPGLKALDPGLIRAGAGMLAWLLLLLTGTPTPDE